MVNKNFKDMKYVIGDMPKYNLDAFDEEMKEKSEFTEYLLSFVSDSFNRITIIYKKINIKKY